MFPPLSDPRRLQPAAADSFDLPASQLAVRWLDGRVYDVGLWRRYALVLAASTLSCTVTLKFAEIQYLEWVFAVDMLVLLGILAWDRMRIRFFRPYLQIAEGYGIFMICAFILSLLALQQDFSYSFQTTLLKQPVAVTVSRMAELLLDAFYMLYLAALYREDQKLCIFGLKSYFWTGMAGCLYCFITYPLNVLANAQLGTYLVTHRFRGFNNEGGGFGLYMLSVILVAAYLYRRGWLSRLLFWISMAVFIPGFVNSQSKSAFFALAMLGLIGLVWLVHGWRRWAVLFGMIAVGAAVANFIDLGKQLDTYRTASAQYRAYSNLKEEDPNYVMGRISGAFLAPRMIAERPLLGVGWGNYPLVRDDKQYRQGTAFSLGSLDAPSLGIVDYIVELGIPLWLFLTWVELLPVVMLARRRVDPWLIALAFVQPVSNWSGAHLNLMHPWVVVAFALGLAYPARKHQSTPAEMVAA